MESFIKIGPSVWAVEMTHTHAHTHTQTPSVDYKIFKLTEYKNYNSVRSHLSDVH